MNKIIAFIFLLLLVSSCVEKIIKEPENLISKDKMTAIFYDLAIVTAAKNTNNEILEKNNIEAMNYIYTKHGIDSLQFIESDLYYASIPLVYKEIYENVEKKLKAEMKVMEDAKIEKRKLDSIAKTKTLKKRDSIKAN
tara:strand:+ start:34179 stop:34592 length:414 start_codon:yes stop_codon:yes gene_type:complete